MSLRSRWQSWRLERRVAKGKQPWGRQHVESEVVGTLSVRVLRADGTVEDLGVVGELREDS